MKLQFAKTGFKKNNQFILTMNIFLFGESHNFCMLEILLHHNYFCQDGLIYDFADQHACVLQCTYGVIYQMLTLHHNQVP